MPGSKPGKYNPGYWLYRTLWTGVDWIFPPRCGGCGKFGVLWCNACQASVNQLDSLICPRCGSFEPHGCLCSECLQSPPPYTALRSWGQFGGALRLAIHRIKYKNDLGLAERLSRNLVDLYLSLSWPVDLITAVPLSLKRKSERGYNQSNLLAYPLARATGVPYKPNAIDRARDTRSQVGLTATQRRENVRGAFIARSSLVEGRIVLVVDDVTTTGSTIQFCAQALLEAGAAEVYGLTLARSMLEEDIQIAFQAANPVVNA
jgi:competence protein ComFC